MPAINNETPSELIARQLRSAVLHRTRVEGCALVWQQWPAPAANAIPLLLIHGGFGSWTHWARNIAGLSKERAVWTLDLPGLGSSDDMPEPQTVRHFAELVLASWYQLSSEAAQFELAGFSFGAMVAGRVAALSGARCSRCTLIGASGFGVLHHQVPLLQPLGSAASPASAREIHRENLARLMLHRAESIDDLAVYIHGDNLARHRFRSRAIAGSDDLARMLPTITAPLVGLWGESDATAGSAALIEARRELFQAAQPNAEFYVLPSVGHWAMYEAPERVNDIILGRTSEPARF